MFNQTHIIYMIISTVATLAVVIPLFFIKNKTLNKVAIWFFAISTVVIHFSGLWHEYLTQGTAQAGLEYIFPIHPCHICMWLLVISATVMDKDTVIARLVKDFTFLGGTVCGSVGILFNINFDKNPTLTDYHVLKGLVSHSTMVAGCLLLFVAGYASARLWRSITSTLFGLGLFVCDGMLVNHVFEVFGVKACNAMYLQEAPFEQFPFVNIYSITVLAILVSAIIGVTYEFVFLPKEKRWYKLLGKKK